MLTKEKIEEALNKSNNNQEAADICGVSLGTFQKYKTKYKLTNLEKSKPKDIKEIISDRLRGNILNVGSFSKENKVDESQIYDILSKLEKEGYAIEKSLSGYYINPIPRSQDLIISKHVKKVKFGVVGDTHFGSIWQQPTLLNDSYDKFVKAKCDFVLHTGDLVDGENIFKGQKYDVFLIGADNQKQYAIDKYPKRKGLVTYMISGNHDLDYQKTNGIDIVKAVAEKRDDIKYCGQIGAYIEFGKKTKAYLYHPGGGTSYAVSYRPQKIIAAMSPENKPNIMFIGHFHRVEYLEDRNVHCFQTSCFQAQTPFLQRLGIEPRIGSWIITLEIDEDGSISRLISERIPYYRFVHRDY